MAEETSNVMKTAVLVDLFLEKVEVMIGDRAVAKSYNLPYRRGVVFEISSILV